MYIVIGTVFLSWLTIRIKYAKETMKSLFNEPKASFDKSSYLLSDVFFMVYPSGTRSYRYLEWLVLCYLFTILLLVLSDFSDILIKHGASGIRLLDLPTFSIVSLPMLANFAITIGCFIVSTYLFFKIKIDCKSIRNLLILMKWFDDAFLPILVGKLQNGKSLVKGKNLFEYRTTDYSQTERLYIKLVKTDGNVETISQESIKVDFAKTLQKFNKQYRYRTDTESNNADQQGITYETLEMREYFKLLSSSDPKLQDPEYYQKITNLIK